MKRFFTKKKIIIFIIIIVILVLIISGLNHKKPDFNTVVAREYTVELGDISSSVSGKATIQPNDQYTVTASVSGDILNTFFEEGDIVTKDQIMFEIDSGDISKSIESADLSLEKANISLQSTNESINNLTIKSSYTGIVQSVNVKVGDSISNGQVIAKVYNDSTMLIKVPFNETDAQNIYAGQSATLTLSDTGTELWGTVSSVSSTSYSLSGYMRVKDVEIKVSNPGSLSPGTKATAMVGDYACNSAGEFEYSVEESIKSTASGKIASLYIKENSKVSKDSVVAILDGDSLLRQKRSNEIAIREAELSRERTTDNLDDYTIKAPIDGTVITKDKKVGDTLDTTRGAITLATIYDMSSLKFDMDVDELDIAKVKIGQEVVITADAVPDKKYTGYVEKINIKGSANNGVTTYPVTVRVNEFEELLPGMNIDADIIIEKVENILIIPSECLNRGNIVYVKGEKETEEDKAPDGFKSVKVEIGLTDSDYIEIKSGLNEGDIVRGVELKNTNGLMEEMDAMMNDAHSGDMSDMMGSGSMPSGRPPSGSRPSR